ncbi:MAG: hypothetical protein OXK72_04080 [Gammaproteobacteria bacterium]|nr:hypothetical protein [Gammaproteobacteria bacterium]
MQLYRVRFCQSLHGLRMPQHMPRPAWRAHEGADGRACLTGWVALKYTGTTTHFDGTGQTVVQFSRDTGTGVLQGEARYVPFGGAAGAGGRIHLPGTRGCRDNPAPEGATTREV